MLHSIALALVFVLAGLPALTVVCGFACQPSAAPTAAGPQCHGEHHDAGDAAAISARHGCDHDVASSLPMTQSAKITLAADTAVDAVPAPPMLSVSPGGRAAIVEYPPGASPGLLGVRSTVLRI